MKLVLTDELLNHFADKFVILKSHYKAEGLTFHLTLEQFIERCLVLKKMRLKRKGIIING